MKVSAQSDEIVQVMLQFTLGLLLPRLKTHLAVMMFDNVILQICLCQYRFTLVMSYRVFLWTAEYNNADDGHGCERMVNASLTMYIGKTYITGGRFKNTYELLTLRALKFSYVNKIHIFQCMGKIFCVEFQRYPLKFHTKYLTHTLQDMIFMQFWNFKSS